MKTEIVKSDYEGSEISFRNDGWFNATGAAFKYGKKPINWLNLKTTKEYILALRQQLGISQESSLIKAKRNSGTWMHPKLAVAFSRWLDVDFGIWCDLQIDNILRGQINTKKLRHEAAASFKVMTSVLQLSREAQGKKTFPHHFQNESRLVNWAITGEFKGLDRDELPADELTILAKLEEKNTVLIGRGVEYQLRKQMLAQHAIDMREELSIKHTMIGDAA